MTEDFTFFQNTFYKVIRKFPCICLLLLLAFLSQPKSAEAAENDSLTESAKQRANKAALYSAILPGSGQVLNKKYWKVPVLYAGFGTLVYFIQQNQKNYTTYKDAFLFRNDSDPSTVDEFPNLTNDDLKVRKDFYRRNRDLSYILTGVVYTLNIIDAYVDAQLRDFDVSENLSMKTGPFFHTSPRGELATGITFTFSLK